MTISRECVDCILHQVEKTLAAIDVDETTKNTIRQEAQKMAPHFSFSHTPPFVAKDVYRMISRLSGIADPLEKVKQESIQGASEHLPFIHAMIEKSDDKIFAALKASVAGNVIDFGAKEQFDLDEEIAKVFETDFALNDYGELLEDIKQYDEIMILADNSGENVYDKVLMETVLSQFPQKKFTYAVRGTPIINDITTIEAKQVGIAEVAEIVDSGVDTPGLDTLRASESFIKRYEDTPLVIAKGMGNYECLEAVSDKNIYFLFKVKCSVVSASIGCEVGSIVLKKLQQ